MSEPGEGVVRLTTSASVQDVADWLRHARAWAEVVEDDEWTCARVSGVEGGPFLGPAALAAGLADAVSSTVLLNEAASVHRVLPGGTTVDLTEAVAEEIERTPWVLSDAARCRRVAGELGLPASVIDEEVALRPDAGRQLAWVTHLDPSGANVMTRVIGSPVTILDAADRSWSLVQGDAGRDLVPPLVGATTLTKTSVAVLFSVAGTEVGVKVLHRGKVVARHRWWAHEPVTVGPAGAMRPPDPHEGVAQLLRRHVRPDAEPTQVVAALAGAGRGLVHVEELARVLGLPEVAVGCGALDLSPLGRHPDARLVRPTSHYRAARRTLDEVDPARIPVRAVITVLLSPLVLALWVLRAVQLAGGSVGFDEIAQLVAATAYLSVVPREAARLRRWRSERASRR